MSEAREPRNWELDDLKALIGQEESARLEFKDSRLFDHGKEGIRNELTEAISAFANSEGGTIVVGITEAKDGKKKGPKVAGGVDSGIDVTAYSLESVQQSLEASIHPPLSGLRFRRIYVDEPTRQRYALVICVPQGTTAYQANDFLYYGRSEYENKALRHHEIQLRMFRSKTPRGRVVVSGHEVDIGNPELRRVVDFHLGVENIGEINITEFKVLGRFVDSDGKILLDQCRESFKDGWKTDVVMRVSEGSRLQPSDEMRVNIYPEDWLNFYRSDLRGHLGFPKGLFFKWILYLANSTPTEGMLDIGAQLSELVAQHNPDTKT